MGSVLLVLSICFVAGVLGFLAIQDWRFYADVRRLAVGTVFNHYRQLGDDGGPSYQAMVRFVTEDGRSIEIYDQMLHSVPQPELGATVEVIYPVGRPETGRVRRPWLRLCIYGALTALLVILGLHGLRVL